MPSAAGTQHWNVYRLPRAEGKNFLITGGNAGIEHFVAAQLASTGATVILGSRDVIAKGRRREDFNPLTRPRRARASPPARSRRPFLAQILRGRTGGGQPRPVVCNAGALLDTPQPCETADGHELMFASSHLGRFVLIRWLLPLLAASHTSRIVTTGGFVAKSARLDLDRPAEHAGLPTQACLRPEIAAARHQPTDLAMPVTSSGLTRGSVTQPRCHRPGSEPWPGARGRMYRHEHRDRLSDWGGATGAPEHG
jgi:hypothetical protein